MAAKYFNHQDALNFEATLQKEKITIADFKIIDGPTVLQHWGVASWLQKEDRQDQDEWPEVLGMFCQAWADLLTAYISLIAFANGADMELAFSYVKRRINRSGLTKAETTTESKLKSTC